MKKIFVSLLIILVASFSSYSQENKAGIIYGSNWAFIICAPEGWIWDSVSWRSNGIYGLFYREGTKIKDGLFIYINPVEVSAEEDLKDFIEGDIDFFKNKYPSIIYKYSHTYNSLANYSLPIYCLNDERNNVYEYVGFLKIKNVVFIFVLVSPSVKDREKNKRAYEELIDSFRFLDKDN